MFRMLSSSFEDDPFFSDSFLAHRESMQQMMRSFSEPFGRDLLSVSDGRQRARNCTRRDESDDSLTPQEWQFYNNKSTGVSIKMSICS